MQDTSAMKGSEGSCCGGAMQSDAGCCGSRGENNHGCTPRKKMMKSVGLLLIRLGLAAVFIAHGLAKFSEMGMTIGFFGTLGLPAVVAYAVAAGELAAGVAMLLGLFTRWAGALIAVIMLGAMMLVKFKAGFLGGYEFDAMLFFAALGIAFIGPGKYSLDKGVMKK